MLGERGGGPLCYGIEHLELVVLGHIGLWTSHRMVRTVLVYVHIG